MFPAATTTVATTTSSAPRGATMSFSVVCSEFLARDELSLYCRAISVLDVAELPPFVDHSSKRWMPGVRSSECVCAPFIVAVILLSAVMALMTVVN
jgi:hypothetical protein